MLSLNIDEICVNTLRFLSVDAVEKAHSGHPGMPMGAAVIAYVLWDRFLKHNPFEPHWPDRDRFILSAGHASMLLYSLLHLTGYDVSLDDLKNFRQWGSKTPGHPEYGTTPGVEATTGPLGQGFANGVGMAIAERHLAELYNRPGYEIINHYTYGLISDGDLQEGVSSEAASLAGNLKLGKLVYLYDSNQVQQDGPTISFSENVALRFQAYGWNVIGPVDGLKISEVDLAIRQARSQNGQPSLIICRTIIGYGSPHKAGTNAAHGEPLGDTEVILAKRQLGWNYDENFSVPQEALAHFREAQSRGKQYQTDWQKLLCDYRQAFPQEYTQLMRTLKGELPGEWDITLNTLFQKQTGPMATRDASGIIMQEIAQKVPSFMGGAADLAGSTRTLLNESGDFRAASYSGRNIRYGLREHAMGAVSNGLALHKGIIPFAGTFLIFSDYLRPALRLAALMKLRIIYVFTHDSIGLGEDGPTHQPVEQLMGLRTIPNLVTIRPADAAETVEAWRTAIQRTAGPTALILTRQKIPVLDRRTLAPASGLQYGGYVLWESAGIPQVILIGTGSEVQIALEAGIILHKKGIRARVVSLPSWALFDSQPEKYRETVLPPEIRARVSIEAAATIGWEHYVGLEGRSLGVSDFGTSAPGPVIFHELGLTSQMLADTALKLL